MTQLAHEIASNEEARQAFLRNIPRWHVFQQTPVQYSPNGKYIHERFSAWADLEDISPDYILEQLETQIMAARLPSPGMDPFIIEFTHYIPMEDLPHRVFISAWVGGVQF